MGKECQGQAQEGRGGRSIPGEGWAAGLAQHPRWLCGHWDKTAKLRLRLPLSSLYSTWPHESLFPQTPAGRRRGGGPQHPES